MASLDFEIERATFREFYNDSSMLLDEARQGVIALVSALINDHPEISVSKIEGRVKDREECIAKFIRKYRSGLEASATPYEIKTHISDLIGVRVVCLYESDIDRVLDEIKKEFEVLSVTNKTAEIEGTDATFGYKGMHVDIKLNGPRASFPEYKRFSEFCFEIQIRTLVQDAWSVIDHKIKYKKSIPQILKRRINTLAALFELADREFLEIRNETARQVEFAERSYADIEKESDSGSAPSDSIHAPRFTPAVLDAFSFQRIANHFFPDFEFEDRKIDGFVQEIQFHRANTTRGKFDFYLKSAIGIVKDYAEWKADTDGRSMNPFTLIRHCLYYGDPVIFHDVLAEFARIEFEKWLEENGHQFQRVEARHIID